MNAFNRMTQIYQRVISLFWTFLPAFQFFCRKKKNLRFSYVTVGPEIIAYCQFTDLHDNLIRGANRVRREISKTVIDRSKLAEFIIPRNNFVETLCIV